MLLRRFYKGREIFFQDLRDQAFDSPAWCSVLLDCFPHSYACFTPTGTSPQSPQNWQNSKAENEHAAVQSRERVSRQHTESRGSVTLGQPRSRERPPHRSRPSQTIRHRILYRSAGKQRENHGALLFEQYDIDCDAPDNRPLTDGSPARMIH